MTTKSRLTAVLAMAAVAGMGLATPSIAEAATSPAAAVASAPFCGIYWGSLPKISDAPLSDALLSSVRSGRHACYDRMVIDVQGPVGGYDVRYVEGTPAPGNPNGLYARGGANLVVFINNRIVPRPAGPYGTIAVQNSDEVTDVAGYQTFRQIREMLYGPNGPDGHVGDMFALGVRAHLPFRVFTLAGPGAASRLVIDVAHRW
jgi:hypothetical protein